MLFPSVSPAILRRFVPWLLVATLVLCGLVVPAMADVAAPAAEGLAGKTFKAAVIRDFPPLYVTGDDDRPAGFAIELLDVMAGEEGFAVDYISAENWGEAMQLVRDGAADFIPGIGIDASRQAEFAFSVAMETIPVSCFVKRGDVRIKGLWDLAGSRYKTAVLVESSAYVELQKRDGYNLVAMDNIDQGLNALLSGSVDAFVFPQPVLRQKLRQMELEDFVTVVGEPLMTLKRGYLFSKGDPHLAAFNRLLTAQVDSPLYAELMKKWYGAPQPFWTVQRVVPLMLVLLVVVSFIIVIWKNHSVRQVNKRLLESEELLARSQEIAHVGSWQLDVSANHLSWSDEVFRIFGCEPDAFAATYEAFLSYVHPDDRALVDAAYTESLRDEQREYEVEHRIVRDKSGQVRYVRQKCVHDRDAAGRVLRSTGMIQDITEQKLAELALQQSKLHLAAQNQELEQIVYVASHDLRSPLVNIDGFSRELEYSLKDIGEVLDRDKEEATPLAQLLRTEFPDMQQSLMRIRTSAHKMDVLLKGLLKLSRLGRASLEIRTIDMNRLLGELVTTFAYRIEQQGIELTVEDLPDCRGDVMQLNQIFSNLLDNAVKYLDNTRPGRIRVSAELDDDYCLYRVEDNGIGIAVNHQTNIFELFHRLHPEDSSGEGLGLTIVRQVLSRLGGEISVSSEAGVGSTFSVRLPRSS